MDSSSNVKYIFFDGFFTIIECVVRWIPSWDGVGHIPPGKIKKLAIIGIFCEILYNFVLVLGFDWSKFSQSGLVAHLKNLIIQS